MYQALFQILIAGLSVAAICLSGLFVMFLGLTVRGWESWWARSAHALVFLAAAAALVFGIRWGVHAVPPGGCVRHDAGRPCVTAPGD
ncbi:hypothetical protein OG607_19435 [Streptomyces sp. NBC_01537]|uniref:hypothetical protein n=1 Tax=Streptomyces sp. NBC_01537 TaxID=2903896 RepID=UPI00386D0F4C